VVLYKNCSNYNPRVKAGPARPFFTFPYLTLYKTDNPSGGDPFHPRGLIVYLELHASNILAVLTNLAMWFMRRSCFNKLLKHPQTDGQLMDNG